MKDKNFWIGVIIAVVAVALYKCSAASPKSQQGQTEEGTLTLSDLNYVSATPSKSLPDIVFSVYKQVTDDQFEEKQVKLEDYKGKPVILHFWATWCNPCLMELPKYDVFAKNQDVHNIAILSENQTPQIVAAFYKKRSIDNLLIAIDREMKLTQAMQVKGLPTTIFINKDGKEVGRVVGPVEWDDKRVVNLLLTQLH
jgi:thiol-disulfide isomerase/thioredoxin